MWGAGRGAFLAAAGAHVPNLDLMLFDLPAVTERAKARLGEAGLLGRTEIHAGDFLADPLPGGADLITLVRILHDHDEAGVLALLRNVRAALPTNGTLLIAEPMAGDERRNRMGEVYFAFYLLSMAGVAPAAQASFSRCCDRPGSRACGVSKRVHPFFSARSPPSLEPPWSRHGYPRRRPRRA